MLCCFFFFQAEDGIRDWSVTGVQTCALPICRHPARHAGVRDRGERLGEVHAGRGRPAQGSAGEGVSGPCRAREASQARSEERRVGKSVGVGGGRVVKKKGDGKRWSSEVVSAV